MYYPSNNQLMETIMSDKCSVAHNDFDVSRNTIKYENNLWHEHDFARLTAKQVDNFLICCITCGSYYCNICGKLLENKVTPSTLDLTEEAILV